MTSFVPELITGHTLALVAIISLVLSLAIGLVDVGIRMFRGAGISATVTAFPLTVLCLFGFTFPIALIAYISGYLATMNRTSAVGTILPAALALIGGLNIYVFGTDNQYRVLITYCVCVFAIMLFYGTQYGAYMREASREARLIALTAQEYRIKIVRRNLGYPRIFRPGW